VTVEQRQPISQVATTSDVEWRWVISISLGILLVFSLPFLYSVWVDARNPDVQFMGFIYNPRDGATYLSKIQLGREGTLRTYFRHSPIQNESGAYLDIMYTLLGRFAAYTGLSNVAIFHMVRLLMALLMCLAIYQFASVVWRKRINRRLYFLWVLFGSGFGWLVVVSGSNLSPDIAIPEGFPLYGMLVNAHFPLAIAMLALCAGIVIQAFRPGFDEEPKIRNGGLTLFLCSAVLALVAPHALVPFTAGLGLMMGIRWLRRRKASWQEFRWLMIIVLPAAPIALYYLAEVQYNPVVAAWSFQNVTPTPVPWIYLLGFGVPLLVALPGIYRAVRQFEADGDQFMLLWLVAIFVLVYMPVGTQRRFSIGVMLPIVYFAVRTVDSYRGLLRRDRYRNRVLASLLAVSAMTYIFLMVLGFFSASNTGSERIYLHQDYLDALEWVADSEGDTGNTVVLANPSVSLWIPGLEGMRVVYAHDYETINAEANRLAVEAWYDADNASAAVCEALPRQFDVAAMLVDEADGDVTACIRELTMQMQFGDVGVYAR